MPSKALWLGLRPLLSLSSLHCLCSHLPLQIVSFLRPWLFHLHWSWTGALAEEAEWPAGTLQRGAEGQQIERKDNRTMTVRQRTPGGDPLVVGPPRERQLSYDQQHSRSWMTNDGPAASLQAPTSLACLVCGSGPPGQGTVSCGNPRSQRRSPE